MFPFKHCGNCKHCGLDMKALMFGFWVEKCHLHNHTIPHPYLKKCKHWRKNDGN